MNDYEPYIILDLNKAHKFDLITCEDCDLINRWCHTVAPTFRFLDQNQNEDTVQVEFEFSEDVGPVRVIDWVCVKTLDMDDPFVKELKHNQLEQEIRFNIYTRRCKCKKMLKNDTNFNSKN